MKKLMLALTSLFTLGFIFTGLVSVGAVDVLDPACRQFNSGQQPGVCQDNKAAQAGGERILFGPTGILTRVVNIFSLVLGAAAVIVLFIASIRFITSNSDPATIAASRMTVIMAVVGLLTASLAQVVVRLVLSKIGG